MASNTARKLEGQRPSIVAVIEEHVDLKQRGRDFWGLCPFHAEKTPSFSVNGEKGVFYCHGCHVGGDVFTFIQKIEGVDFKTAAKRLGLETYRPSPAQLRVKQEAREVTAWAHGESKKLCDSLREIGDQIRLCRLLRKLGDTPGEVVKEVAEIEAGLIREWAILCDLDDDLNDPKVVLELWQQREDIDNFMGSIA